MILFYEYVNINRLKVWFDKKKIKKLAYQFWVTDVTKKYIC